MKKDIVPILDRRSSTFSVFAKDSGCSGADMATDRMFHQAKGLRKDGWGTGIVLGRRDFFVSVV